MLTVKLHLKGEILKALMAIFSVFLATTLISQQTAWAQNIASGTVVDENGEPVVGCMVYLNNKEKGTMTDENGKFSLDVPSGSKVRFSMLGMVEIELAPSRNMTVVLKTAVNTLDDVVVVGYGTQKRASLTGAISTIDHDAILTTKSQSLAVSLAGKVPGLRIRETNGMPGAFSSDINMRGLGTPMIVIDGVVRQETTEFQKLNPDDIESITVLKDASAAIYGMNSSNGAIIITTKSGKEGPIKISFSANLGFTKPTAYTKMMNGSQYWEVRNEDSYFSNGSPYFATREELERYQSLPDVDWYDETFKKHAFQQTYNVSLEGGNEKIQSYTNIGYTSDNGLLRSGDINYSKFSLRNGSKYKINDWISAELSIYGYKDLRSQPGTWDDAFFYLNKSAHGIIPTETVYANNNENYYNRPAPINDNPVEFSQREYAGYGEWRDRFFQGQASIRLDIPYVPGLYFKAAAFYDFKSYVRTRVQKEIVNYIYSESDDTYTPYSTYDPSIREESTTQQRFNIQTSINYKNTFHDAHNVSATVVFEPRKEDTRYVSAMRRYKSGFFTTDNIDRAPEAGQTTSGNTSEAKFLSVIGRFNYDYKGRYLIEFAFREDGSYRYAPSKRWGFFPVVSGGWRISEEPFLKDKIDFLSNLKIRASWGKSGEDAGNAFQYMQGYGSYNGYVFSDGTYTNGYASTGLVNANLTWVKTEMTNIGLDISLWDGKLDFSGDIYKRTRKGLLGTRLQALPNTFGATLPQENLNEDMTEGYEIVLSHKNTINDFYYGISMNLNFARWQVTKQERAAFRSSMDKWRNGSVDRWGDIGWGYTVTGQYQSEEEIQNSTVIESGTYGMQKTLPGDYIHEDYNGDGIIDSDDMKPKFWNGSPKLNYGLNLYCSWRGLDFNMLWSGAGYYTAKYNEILGNVLALDYSNSPEIYYDRWHKEDLYDPNSAWVSGKYPAVRRLDSDNGSNRLESNKQRVNASYLRLKNVELGYTLPQRITKKALISNLRVYINMTNPLIICNSYLKTFDPEISDGNGFQYPIQKSLNFGANITF